MVKSMTVYLDDQGRKTVSINSIEQKTLTQSILLGGRKEKKSHGDKKQKRRLTRGSHFYARQQKFQLWARVKDASQVNNPC